MIRQKRFSNTSRLKKEIHIFFTIVLLFGVLFTVCKKAQEDQIIDVRPVKLGIDANIVFFYYKDLAKAQNFYEDILGLKLVADYGLAKVYQVSQTSYVGLVDEKDGMHSASEPKSVTLSFLTKEIDEWYNYLKEKQVEMRGAIHDSRNHPTRNFVALDPEGYYLEFERFLDHEQNKKLLKQLNNIEAVYPQENQSASRPKELGFQANLVFLYYADLDGAQRFYEDVLGFELFINQPFAKIYYASPTFFVGLVDAARGMHSSTEEKAVNVSFLTEDINRWYKILRDKGLEMRVPMSDSETIPIRSFVTYDIEGYFLEFGKIQKFDKQEE